MVCYLVNRSLLLVLELKTLYKVWCSFVDYSKLRVFSYLVYTHVKKNKLGSRARKYIFLSYASGVKGYQLCFFFYPKSSKFITSKEKKLTNIYVEMDHGTSKQVELEVRA
jgi:hypothetical protein